MSLEVKLIKIASEINISRGTIVDYLLTRGYSIDNKVTSVLSEEMIDVVYDKFKREKKDADTQRKKVQRQKEKKGIVSHISIEDNVPVVEVENTAVFDKRNVTVEDSLFPIHHKEVQATLYDDVEVDNIPEVEVAEPTHIEIVPNIPIYEPTIVESSLVGKTEEPPLEKPKKKISIASPKEIINDVLPKVGEVIAIPIDPDAPKGKRGTSEKTRNARGKNEAKIASDKKKNESKKKASKQDGIVSNTVVNPKSGKSSRKSSTLKVVSTFIPIESKAKKPLPPPVVGTRPIIDKKPVLDLNADERSNKNNERKNISVKGKNTRHKSTEPDYIPGENPSLKGLTVLGKIEIQKKVVVPKVVPTEEKKTYSDRSFKSRKGAGDGRNTEDKRTSSNYVSNRNYDHRRTDGESSGGAWTYHTNFGGNRDRSSSPYTKVGTTSFANRQQGETDGKIVEKRIFTNDAPPKGTRTFNNYDNKPKKRKPLRELGASDFDVDKAIRATLIDMEDTGIASKKAKIKLKKKAVREEKEAKQQEITAREEKTLKLTEYVTTSDLAALVKIKPSEIILKCMQLGLMVTINQRLDKDTILLIADDYGFEVEFIEDVGYEDIIEEVDDTEETLIPRPPIVTIMGHVDHGKTSLLDHIRNANVVAGEAGGITQHIGAYRVILKNGKSITFLDTPGHEAFTAMRARGAQVTDIVVLVVAADDSVMPQTIEAISHARAANVPMIVAINKIDRPDANIDKIKQQLSDQGVLVEDWGGKFQCAEISAKKGTNVNVLLDKILLEAEMLDLRANPDRNASGVVIETRMTKGWGNVASVIIQKGTLYLQDYFVAGAHYGKIRALLDERGNKVEDVLPSQPVVVIGFDGLPDAGDTFVVMSSEAEAREIATKRKQLRREQEMRMVHHTTLDDISSQIAIGGVRDLNLIIKADVAGSIEALSDSLLELSTEEVRVNIIYKAAGIITESDVMLASASNAVLIGFNISTSPQAAKLAEVESVDIRRYNIIYECIDEVKLALEGLLKPDIKEEISATVEVRQIFKISKVGQIAGCYVSSGKVMRNDKVRVLRDGFPIYSGTLSSLKRIKDDVREVDTGYECGIQISGFNSFEENDIIECYKLVEIKRKLD